MAVALGARRIAGMTITHGMPRSRAAAARLALISEEKATPAARAAFEADLPRACCSAAN